MNDDIRNLLRALLLEHPQPLDHETKQRAIEVLENFGAIPVSTWRFHE